MDKAGLNETNPAKCNVTYPLYYDTPHTTHLGAFHSAFSVDEVHEQPCTSFINCHRRKKVAKHNNIPKPKKEPLRRIPCFQWNSAGVGKLEEHSDARKYTNSDPCFKHFQHGGCCGRVQITDRPYPPLKEKTTYKSTFSKDQNTTIAELDQYGFWSEKPKEIEITLEEAVIKVEISKLLNTYTENLTKDNATFKAINKTKSG